MDTESRVDAINEEFQQLKEELQEILMDIRTYLMEAQSPIPNDLDKEKLRQELDTERG
jgi:hypothetical protein